jgi:hypothetical protein
MARSIKSSIKRGGCVIKIESSLIEQNRGCRNRVVYMGNSVYNKSVTANHEVKMFCSIHNIDKTEYPLQREK